MSERKIKQVIKRDRKGICKFFQRSVIYVIRTSCFSSGKGSQCQFNFLKGNGNRIKMRQIIRRVRGKGSMSFIKG